MGEPLELLHKNKADSVFKNCKIYTSDVKYKWADRFAVKGDKFIAVGSEHTDEYIGETTQIIDLKGRTVLPGFIDSHGHPVRTVMKGLAVFFSRHMSRKEVIDKISEFARNNREIPLIFGVGYKDGMFDDVYDEKGFLDALCSDRPVVLLSDAGAESLMNTSAIKKSGIESIITAHIPKVEIIKKDQLGHATGRIIGIDSIMKALQQLQPFDTEKVATRIEELDKEYSSRGFIGVFDCGSYEYLDYIYLWALKKFWHNKELRHKLFGSVTVRTLKDAKLANKKLTHKRMLAKETATTATVNILRLKYNCDETCSEISREAIRILCIEAANKGFSLQFDTINKHTTSEVLRLVQDIRKAGFNKLTVSLASAEKLDESDIVSVAANRLIANSGILYKDKPDIDIFKKLKRMSDSGIPITFGADLGAAKDEKPENRSEMLIQAGFKTEDIIGAFTLNAAKMLHMEEKLGSISVGKQADFVVLDEDIFDSDTFDIARIKAYKTFVNGKCVYSL